MSKTAFYKIDFKPDYQIFQQKISELSSKKERIQKKQIKLETVQHELQLIKEEINDQGFEFNPSNIFLRYANSQETSQKKKTASDTCLHCGQELKKSLQCEICAEVYCKSCCWRKRTIPFQKTQDMKLCCEQCHQKYIKHFNNQQFYKEKAVYLAAIEELERKYEKAQAKNQKKQSEVKQYKEQKKTAKIKQAILRKDILEEQKLIKQLNEQFQKAMKEKAIRINLQEQKRKIQAIQAEQKQKKQQLEKQLQDQQRIEQLEKDKKIFEDISRQKQQQLARRQAQIKKEKQKLQQQRKLIADSRLKQQTQLLIKKTPSKTQQKTEFISILIQSPKTDKIILLKAENGPQQIAPERELDFDSILNQAQNQSIQQLLKQSSLAKNSSRKPITQKIDHWDQQHSILKEEPKFVTKQVSNQSIPKKLPSLTNEQSVSKQMAPVPSKTQKQQQEKPQNSQNSFQQQNQSSNQVQINSNQKLTMEKIKTMKINDLLSMKIPMNPSSTLKQRKNRQSMHQQIKTERSENSTTSQNQKMHQSLGEPFVLQENFLVGLSISNNFEKQKQENEQSQRPVQQTPSFSEEKAVVDENQNHKIALLRESLISSAHKSSLASQKAPDYNEQLTEGDPKKCTCEIF